MLTKKVPHKKKFGKKNIQISSLFSVHAKNFFFLFFAHVSFWPPHPPTHLVSKVSNWPPPPTHLFADFILECVFGVWKKEYFNCINLYFEIVWLFELYSYILYKYYLLFTEDSMRNAKIIWVASGQCTVGTYVLRVSTV